ncbi:MAG: SAM-dependent methyltransferase [Reyranellaceae bacterium]
MIDTTSLSAEDAVEECRRAEEAGGDVAWLHPGDLSAGALAEQLRRLDELAVPYTVTPGVPYAAAATAALGAGLSSSDMPSIALTGGIGPGWTVPAAETLQALARSGASLAVHLPAEAVSQLVEALMPLHGGEVPVSVIDGLAGPSQQITRGTLATIVERIDPSVAERIVLVLVGKGHAAPEASHAPQPDADRPRRHRRRGA